MEEKNSTRYFLGANSVRGFFSCYEDFADSAERLIILKGGPGCGKSSLMKALAGLAENAGYRTEKGYCSGDPGSLDCVHIPALGASLVDGTAPHLLEPRIPAIRGSILNLGAFYDEAALRGKAETIEVLTEAYRAAYAEAYGWLGAYGAVPCPALRSEVLEKNLARAENAAKRLCKRGHGSGRTQKRFLRAFTGQGFVSFAADLPGNTLWLENRFGLGSLFLQRLSDRAKAAGYDITEFCHPLFPDRLEALQLPECALTLAAVPEEPGEGTRVLRLEQTLSREEKAALRQTERLRRPLLQKAQEALQKAAAKHDALEACYNPHVAFSEIYALAEPLWQSLRS